MKIKLSEKHLRSLAKAIEQTLNDQLIAQGLILRIPKENKESVISIYQENWNIDEIVFGNEDNPRFILDIEEYTIINEHGTTGTKSSLSTSGRREIRSTAFDGKDRCTQQ